MTGPERRGVVEVTGRLSATTWGFSLAPQSVRGIALITAMLARGPAHQKRARDRSPATTAPERGAHVVLPYTPFVPIESCCSAILSRELGAILARTRRSAPRRARQVGTSHERAGDERRGSGHGELIAAR